MNKIYKVMYSKVKQCAVVVSEIAKSHGHNEGRSAVRKHTALTAAVLIALGTFTFMGTPAAQAEESVKNNDFVAANSTYWYWDTKTNTWKTYDYHLTDVNNNRSWNDLPNYKGGGAKLPGAITAGQYAQAGQQTITIGDRNAGQSKGSVFIGEHSGYNIGDNVPSESSLKNNYVTAVGFQSDATGWGSIAIGSNAIAENTNTKNEKRVVNEVGEKGNLSTVSDDVYGIESNPSIEGASVALGYNAHAKDGNIAIGAYSQATEDSSKPYVSVGNSTLHLQRRITNVADGADVTDAATVGQLQALEKKTIAYNEGWGIKIGDYTKKDAAGNETTVKNAISVDRNLGSNEITTKSKNTFKAAGENSLILGGAGTDNLVSIDGNPRETQFGAYGKDSVLVGGENNKITDAGTYAVISGGSQNIASGEHSFIGGGWWNTASGATSAVLGGQSNIASGNQSTVVGGESNRAIGDESTILGGFQHNAIGDHSTISGGDGAYTFGTYSSVSGGQGNVAIGVASSADGGWLNYSYGDYSQANGGYSNYTLGNASNSLGGRNGVVQGNVSVGIAGGSTEAGAGYALAAGYQSVVTAAGVHKEKSNDPVDSYLEAGNNTGGNEGYKYTDVATALGYQATADAPNTVSFGHDKGDVSGYTVNWDYEFETDAQGNMKFDENGMPLVKSLKPNSITTNYYDTAKYNRLVKVADGIEDHDAVVMEQLKNASGVGSKIKVYQTDENGNIKFDKNNKPIEDTSDAAKTAQKASKDAWGQALGADVFSKGTTTTTTNASTSDQLVTGKTLYDYDKPTGSTNYVNVNNTTGQNLIALDAQVKANADALTKPNHNIKYYAVDETTLPKLTNFNGKDYSNEKNNGAVGMGSIAAGFNTHADGIASTVAGSYSGVINTGDVKLMGYDFRGATALSYGTFNVNKSTDQSGVFSGVANSIVGQANATTDSNAAIIYGAGNTVTNSYRKIDDTNASEIMQAALSKDVKKLDEALQKAVPTSGGQVMVMGGGNNVESAYMTQVVGVGNTVKGNQVKNDKGEWVTDTSDTAIKGYDKDKSSQYNYVDGFSNEVINGKHDYVIGANNKLSGDSYDDDTAQPIKRSNRSNIVIGDNHTLTREQNTVIIGSSDTENTQTKARDAVIIGHNANATNDTGADNAVAIGRSAKATGGNAVTIGVNTSAGANSITIGSESSAISGSNIAIGRYAKVYGDKVTNAVALGKLAEAHVADGVAIGSNSIASTVAGKTGYDAQGKTHAATDEDYAAWVSTDAAVSVGGADHEVKYTDKDNKERSKIVKSTRQITNLAAGTKDTDAVNVAQLKSLQSGLTEDLTGKGLKFAANSGAYTAKLGTTVKIQGTDKKAGHEYTADNLTTEIDGSGNITILMDKDMSVEKLAVNGKAGEKGQPGTPGSIGIKGQDGKAGIGIDGKNGISIKGQKGTDGVTIKGIDGVDGVDGAEGHIGLNGKDGMTDIFTTAGKPGLNGKDGETMTRIVYKDPNGTEHQTATLDDGLKFKGDDETVIAKKLNNQLDIIGGAAGTLTDGNIGVKSTTDGKLKVQLAQDLTKITSISNQTTTGAGDQAKTTGARIDLGSDGTTTISGGDVNVSGNKITHVGSGIEAEKDGKYAVTDANKSNAANIGDVDHMVNQAVGKLSNDTKVDLAGKANVDASNLTPDNVTKWQEKLGNGKVESGNTGLVTGNTVFKAVDTKANRDGSNLTDTEADSFSEKIARGEVKDGENRAVSGDAVNTAISKVTGDVNTKLDGKANTSLDNITEGGRNVIRKLAKDSIEMENGNHTTVSSREVDGVKTFKVDVTADGKVESGDTGLISGGTAYSELRPADGSYVKQANTTAVNLFALDTGLKATSDLIHTNTSHDTIQIGENSTATKIDVSGKDANGKTTGRVITGVISDAGDPNSAANVGYVNGVTAANTQQIYRDMNNAYGRLNNNINKAAAGSNALAALHPLDYDPDDKADFAVGYGHYRNANAAAVGAFYHPNENTMVNVGVSLGNGDPGFNAGVSFKIGSGSAGHQAMSKTEMAKVINSQSKEIDALKKDNADKDKRIDALEQKMAEILAKLDKNGK